MNEEQVEGEKVEDHPKTNKPTMIFITVAVVVFVIILGFVFFALKTKEEVGFETVDYNYFVFEKIGGLWQTNIQLDDQLYEAVFRFNPEQVEDVDIAGDFTGFRASPLYITFDPDADDDEFKYLALAASELTLHVTRALNVTVEAACTKNETDACIDRPVVTCDDKDKSVIYLVPKPPTQITLDDSCVTLNGNDMDLLKGVDRLLFQWYKIIT
jgi:hypothetical protein